MRALLGATVSLENLFSESEPPSLIQLTRRKLSSEAVLCLDRNRSQFIKEEIQNISDDFKKNQVISILESGPWTFLPTQHSEFLIEESEVEHEGALSKALLNENFEQLVEWHQSNREANETREEAYGRTLGHLLPHAKKVEILDPYALSNFMNSNSDSIWFLEQLLRNPIVDLTIYTSHDYRDTLDIDSVISNIDFLWKQDKRKVSDFHLVVFPSRVHNPTRDFPHDRWITIKLIGQQTINGRLGKGMQVFGRTGRFEMIEPGGPSLPIGAKKFLEGFKSKSKVYKWPR